MNNRVLESYLSELYFRIHRRVLMLILIFLAFSMFVFGQAESMVSGLVTDSNDDPLPGVNIMIKGTTRGIISNIDGEFSIEAEPSDVLILNFLGFKTLEVPVGSNRVFNVSLEDEVLGLEEVVVVGYGSQTKLSVTGALGSIKSEELLKSPVPSVANALAGRSPGVFSVQRGGEPGRDNANIYIRGIATFAGDEARKPLVLVDGIERNLNSVDPNEIESVNVLKDASSTAVFGVRGANGVIIITTKTGQVGRPRVSFTSNFGWQNPIRMPDLLNAFDWASLRNEAAQNDNEPLPFTENDLELFSTGADPNFHPDVNWFDLMLKDYSPQQQYNVNISGGTKEAKYFVSLGYLTQQGAFKLGDFFKDFSANPNFERYNIRTNFDFEWSKNLSTSIKAGTQITTGNYSTRDARSVFGTVFSANPIMSPVIVDGKMIRNVEGLTAWQISNTPLYEMLWNGYNTNYSSSFNMDVSTVYKMDYVTKGLRLRGKVAYDNYYMQTVTQRKQIPMYDLMKDPNDPTGHVLIVNQYEGPIAFNSESFNKSYKIYGEGGVEYDRTISGNTIGALLLGTTERFYRGGNELPFNYLGLVARTTYNFKNRYMAEFNMGYNGSENFAKGKQFGFFPSVSASYVLSEELFFPENELLTFFKIRGSIGKVGNDKSYIGNNYYRFIFTPDSYKEANHYYFGFKDYWYSNPTAGRVTGYTENILGNPNVTWEVATKWNLGLDLKFFSDRLSLNGDYFTEDRENILWQLNIPVTFGQASLVAPYNIGMAHNKGYEIEIGYNDRIQSIGLDYWLNGNYSYARNEIIYMDETPQPFPGLVATGNRIGQPKGLLADGLYNTWEEIDDPSRPRSEWEGAGLRPGDLRYVDVNKDGVIDENDRVNIGHPNIPGVMYGISLGFRWKGFEANVLFQGADQVSTYIQGEGAWPFIAGTKVAFESAKESWTQERFDAGLPISLPRLTGSPNASNHNYRYSSFWQQDAAYLRLKNAEIGYSFNAKGLNKYGVKSLRVFVNGQNLHTWTKMKYFDPEIAADQNGATYPMMRVFNTGFNVQF